MTSQRGPERELLSLREFQIEAESNPNFHQKILQYHKIVRLFGHRGLVVGFGGPFKDNQLLSRPCNGEHVILEVRTAETGWFVGLVEARLYVTGSPEAFQNAERKEKEEAQRKKAAGEENKRCKTAHEKEEEEEGKTENKQASSSSSSQIAKTEDRSEKPAEVQAEGAAENVEEIKFILPKVDIRLSSPMEENMGIEVEDVDVAGQEEVEETGQTGNETQQEESEVPKSTEEEIAQQKKDAKKRAAALNKMPTASLDLKTVYFLQPAKETEDCERDLVLLICLMTFLKSPNIKVFCSPGPATYLPKGPYGPDELEKQAEALALAPAAAAAGALEDIPRTAAEAAAPPDESMAVDLGEGVVESSTAVAAVHHETSVPFRFEQDPKLQPTPKAIKKTKAKKTTDTGGGEKAKETETKAEGPTSESSGEALVASQVARGEGGGGASFSAVTPQAAEEKKKASAVVASQGAKRKKRGNSSSSSSSSSGAGAPPQPDALRRLERELRRLQARPGNEYANGFFFGTVEEKRPRVKAKKTELSSSSSSSSSGAPPRREVKDVRRRLERELRRLQARPGNKYGDGFFFGTVEKKRPRTTDTGGGEKAKETETETKAEGPTSESSGEALVASQVARGEGGGGASFSAVTPQAAEGKKKASAVVASQGAKRKKRGNSSSSSSSSSGAGAPPQRDANWEQLRVERELRKLQARPGHGYGNGFFFGTVEEKRTRVKAKKTELSSSSSSSSSGAPRSIRRKVKGLQPPLELRRLQPRPGNVYGVRFPFAEPSSLVGVQNLQERGEKKSAEDSAGVASLPSTAKTPSLSPSIKREEEEEEDEDKRLDVRMKEEHGGTECLSRSTGLAGPLSRGLAFSASSPGVFQVADGPQFVAVNCETQKQTAKKAREKKGARHGFPAETQPLQTATTKARTTKRMASASSSRFTAPARTSRALFDRALLAFRYLQHSVENGAPFPGVEIALHGAAGGVGGQKKGGEIEPVDPNSLYNGLLDNPKVEALFHFNKKKREEKDKREPLNEDEVLAEAQKMYYKVYGLSCFEMDSSARTFAPTFRDCRLFREGVEMVQNFIPDPLQKLIACLIMSHFCEITRRVAVSSLVQENGHFKCKQASSRGTVRRVDVTTLNPVRDGTPLARIASCLELVLETHVYPRIKALLEKFWNSPRRRDSLLKTFRKIAAGYMMSIGPHDHKQKDHQDYSDEAALDANITQVFLPLVQIHERNSATEFMIANGTSHTSDAGPGSCVVMDNHVVHRGSTHIDKTHRPLIYTSFTDSDANIEEETNLNNWGRNDLTTPSDITGRRSSVSEAGGRTVRGNFPSRELMQQYFLAAGGVQAIAKVCDMDVDQFFEELPSMNDEERERRDDDPHDNPPRPPLSSPSSSASSSSSPAPTSVMDWKAKYPQTDPRHFLPSAAEVSERAWRQLIEVQREAEEVKNGKVLSAVARRTRASGKRKAEKEPNPFA